MKGEWRKIFSSMNQNLFKHVDQAVSLWYQLRNLLDGISFIKNKELA
jgi:hypothetical protein